MASTLLKRLVCSGKSRYCSTVSSFSIEEVKPKAAVKRIDTLEIVTRLQSHGIPFETAKAFATEIKESLHYILDVSCSKSEMEKAAFSQDSRLSRFEAEMRLSQVVMLLLLTSSTTQQMTF